MKVIACNQQAVVPLSLSAAQRLVRFILQKMEIDSEEVRLYFIERATMIHLHARYLQKRSATDCLSFVIDPPGSTVYPRILGEILVCPEMAQRRVPPAALYRELTLYVIHGLLHLLGFEDQTSSRRAQMRAAEEEWLARTRRQQLWIGPPRREGKSAAS